MMLVLAVTAQADGKRQLQKYFSDTATKVKATENVSEKRAILQESFENMTEVLAMVQRSPSLSKDDQAGLDRLQATLQEKQDELAGVNGFDRVADGQLNAFAQYVVQDMEQADQMITISVVTLLLILILVVLIV